MLDEDGEEEKVENAGDLKISTINEGKNSILESKKVTLPLHKKKLSQN